MKKIVLWQIIVSMMTLAVFFSGYPSEVSDAAGVADVLAFFVAFFTALFAWAARPAVAIAVLTTTLAAVLAAVVVNIIDTIDTIAGTITTIGIIAIFVAFTVTEIKGRKIPFAQHTGSLVAEFALLYGIMAGFLHGMVIAVWLPTLIAAIVSTLLFGVAPAIRLRARRRLARLEKRAQKLRIALEEEPSCSYRIQAEPEDRQAPEAELEACEDELAKFKAESLA